MKNLFILILAVLCKTAFSQQVVEAYLFADKERPILEKFVKNDSLTTKERDACSLLSTDRNFINGLFKSNFYDHTAVKKDVIIIVLRDVATNKIVPIGGANVGSVTYKFEGGSDVPIIVPAGADFIPFEMAKLTGVPSGNTVTEITVNYKDAAGASKTSVIFFRYLNQWSNYGAQVFGSPFGIWLPVGQFGSNLKKTEKGVIFNALPIGLALGTKFNLSQKFYLGASYSFDYTITGAGVTI